MAFFKNYFFSVDIDDYYKEEISRPLQESHHTKIVNNLSGQTDLSI